MRVGAGWSACGAALAVLLLAAPPGAAQQQQQQQQQQAATPPGSSPAGSYAVTLRDTEARLGRAIEQAQGNTGRTQAGAMPPGQQQLMDATQAAWQAMQSGAPEAMRGATGPYADADHAFRRAVETMRVGQTPPDQALAAARDAQAALGRLREAAASQAGGAEAAGASTPSPGAASQGPIQEPPRR